MIIELEIGYDVFDLLYEAFYSREKVDYLEIKKEASDMDIAKRDLTLARYWLGVKAEEYADGSRYWILKHDSEGREKLYGMEQQNQ